jgi:hypothetical protein
LSVHVETTADGRTVYRVRWREGGRGTANRNRTFDDPHDADAFDRRVRRLKQTGDPARLADDITLREYVYGEWWPNYAERRLALSTQEGHSIDLELRIIPRLGHVPLTLEHCQCADDRRPPCALPGETGGKAVDDIRAHLRL